MGLLKRIDFLLFWFIVLVTVVLAIGRVLGWYSLGFFIGPFRASHWLGIIGSTYIAVATPAFSFLKRRFQARYEALAKFHVIGNLSAVLLVTIHFTSQLTRSASNYPQLGNGLALYIVMLLLVVSGFLYRFRILPRISTNTKRFVHVGVALSFYILIGIHVLHGIGIL